MTIEEMLKEVLSRNVKDEDLRNDLFDYCVMKKDVFHTTDYTYKYDYDLQRTRTIIIVLLNNIEHEMLTMHHDLLDRAEHLFETVSMTEYLFSLIKERVTNLKDILQNIFVFQALSEVAEFNETTRNWTLKEDV